MSPSDAAKSPDTTARFGGLAAGYARFRPDYPASAIDFIFARGRLKPGHRFVDVGSGTGISTRLLTARGLQGVGVEPNDDMRQAAESLVDPNATYRAGTARATGLPETSANLVLAAQAFHWFPNDETLQEFHRLLVPGGLVALMWYEQDTTDALTAAYVAAQVAHSPEPRIAAWKQSETGAILLTSPRFINAARHTFRHQQELDWTQLRGRAFTASYAPKDSAGRQHLEDAMRAAFDAHQREGVVVLRYDIIVYTATRPS